ncbi:hypothetical protein BDN72DRAFT_897026 [Pluteus cervinus]|uniref:Uncharacterized protein n=1 Tax=Pluteus cervinus TaxID=181527 RepID=A0ACD3AUR2_9AGAR|nr:hypothetical protein BDN72DRAFT_897026 [Pluteus cervinus]
MTSIPVQTRTPDSYSGARKRIDEEIIQLEARIISLKLARNNLSPIARLHPEILQEIFFLAHHSTTPKGEVSLLLSWVSHAWRELAHDTSTLWAYIDFPHPRWIETALSRSKNRELAFVLDCVGRTGQHNWEALVPLCLGNLPRIKSLHIKPNYGGNWAAFPELSPEWTTSAPLLEELNLARISLPASLFSGNCASLQSLELLSCKVDWGTFPISPSLLRIAIINPRSRTTAGVMIKTLRCVAPHLEELKVKYALLYSAAPPSVDRIPFNKLKVLVIHERDPDVVEEFFDRCSLPRHLDVEVSISEWEDSALATALVSAQNIPSLEIKTLKTGLETSPRTENLEGPAVPFPAIVTKPPLTTFLVGGYHGAQDLKILEYFGKLAGVRIFNCDPPFLMNFLALIKDQTYRLQGMQPLRPSEEEATARSVLSFHDLRVLELVGEINEVYFLLREEAEALQRWLMWRKRAGIKLERLVIARMLVPALNILHQAFDDLVGELNIVDVEVNDSQSMLLESSDED